MLIDVEKLMSEGVEKQLELPSSESEGSSEGSLNRSLQNSPSSHPNFDRIVGNKTDSPSEGSLQHSPSQPMGSSARLAAVDDSLPPVSQQVEEPSSRESFDELAVRITTPGLSAEAEKKLQYSKGVKWEPQQLNSRHREIMRRILEGATYIEIAEDIGVSPQSIMLVASSEIFKSELRQLEGSLNLNVIRRAEELSNEALDKLKRLMRKAKSEALQAMCAEKVLGIAGYSKIEKKQIAVVSGEDVIRELNRQRRERQANEIELGS